MIGIKLDVLPKNCWVCPLAYTKINGNEIQSYCPYLETHVEKFNKDKRHKRCPLVELKGETE